MICPHCKRDTGRMVRWHEKCMIMSCFPLPNFGNDFLAEQNHKFEDSAHKATHVCDYCGERWEVEDE